MYKRVLYMCQKIRTSCTFTFKSGVTSQKRPAKKTYIYEKRRTKEPEK